MRPTNRQAGPHTDVLSSNMRAAELAEDFPVVTVDSDASMLPACLPSTVCPE
jgi:hypothetical protein